MTPEHWQLISRLYHDALAREADARRRFSARRVLATRLSARRGIAARAAIVSRVLP